MSKEIKYSVITSFSQNCYDNHAHIFIRTFNEFFADDIELLIYSEDDLDIPLDKIRSTTKIYNLYNESKKYNEYFSKFENNEYTSGRKKKDGTYWKTKALEEKYNYRFDANKFCKKVFSVEDGMNKASSKKIIWIDADTFFFTHVTSSMLDNIIPSDKCCSFLGRNKVYTECGFVSYNCAYSKARRLIQSLAHMYVTGEFMKEPEWHDSFLWDICRKNIMTEEDWYDLPSRHDGRPWDSSDLSKFSSHMKGAIKETANHTYQLVSHQKTGVYVR
jgi:hypothetical protein